MKKYFTFISMAIIALSMSAMDAVQFEFSDGIEPGSLKSKMERQVCNLLTAINRAAANNTAINYAGIDINGLASQSLNQMWTVVHFETEDNDYVDHCIRQRSKTGRLRGFQLRNIGVNMKPVSSGYDGPTRRELTIDFGPTGIIEDVNFAMGTHEYTDLLKKGEQLGDLDRRMQIVHWCEQFQNAYNKCDIKFMNNIFSDDAIIITGKISQRRDRNTDVQMRNPIKEEYVQQTKKQYLAKLSSIFAHAKYINVQFSEYKIVRHGSKPNYYGVTLRQKYATNTYKDEGIVFLVWDFTNEDEPKIHVRTWQPLTEEAFALGDFRLP